MTFSWDDTLSVGNSFVDSDHKIFFEIANLLEMAQTSKNVESQEIHSALLLLKDYVRGHFRREEMAMDAAEFPNRQSHKNIHRAFKEKIDDIIARYEDDVPDAAQNLPALVTDWLRQHICSEDRSYVQWLQGVTVDDRPLGVLALEAET